jgi:hypothetical protein
MKMSHLLFGGFVVSVLELSSVFVFADHGSHLVISQVQITGGPGQTTNDFVEIYNPTGSDVNLEGHRLVKRTKTGTTDTTLKSWTQSAIVKAHGYYLWASSSYAAIPTVPDTTTSGTIADDNGVALRQGPEDTGVIVDAVAWGQAANAFVEGQAFSTNPGAGESLERKPGGSEGNATDTDNNAADWFIQATSHPRNTASPPVPPAQGTPPAPVSAPPSGGAGIPVQYAREVEISEIMPNPAGADAGNEWVELFNAAFVSVDLGGWLLGDSTTTGGNGGGKVHIIETGTTIAPQGYVVIQIPKGTFALNNTSDSIKLFHPDNALLAEVSYSGPVPPGQAYAKMPDRSFAWTSTVTQGSTNAFPVQSFAAAAVIISELFPNPAGADQDEEFIELQNTGEDDVDLTGWKLSDGARTYMIGNEDEETELAAGSYLVFPRTITKIALNNTGVEQVSLLRPDSRVAFETSYEDAPQGSSWSRSSAGIWAWSDIATPGRENIISQAAATRRGGTSREEAREQNAHVPPRAVSLSEIRNVPLGTMVQVEGIVSVPQGVLDAGILYLAGSGIRVRIMEGVATVRLGDLVSLIGEVARRNGEYELRVRSRDIATTAGSTPPSPQDITPAQVAQFEGALVRARGVLKEQDRNSLTLEQNGAQARVLIEEMTGIRKPQVRAGAQLTVTGIVSQFNGHFRILPRYQDDIVVAASAAPGGTKRLPRTGGASLETLVLFALLSLFCYIFLDSLRLWIAKHFQSFS